MTHKEGMWIFLSKEDKVKWKKARDDVEKERLQEIFFNFSEFKPLLTPEQYKVYVKHLKKIIKYYNEGF